MHFLYLKITHNTLAVNLFDFIPHNEHIFMLKIVSLTRIGLFKQTQYNRNISTISEFKLTEKTNLFQPCINPHVHATTDTVNSTGVTACTRGLTKPEFTPTETWSQWMYFNNAMLTAKVQVVMRDKQRWPSSMAMGMMLLFAH